MAQKRKITKKQIEQKEVKAEARFIRISPRKVRLVVDSIKDLGPKEALDNLEFINKRAAKPLSKLIKSAMANAKKNYGLKEDSLRFKEIQVGKGPTFKRWRAISRGRTHQIMKRTSRIKVVLEGTNGTKG
jgi:large subunit ribosomal protein L22